MIARDKNTNAILNTDTSALNKYKQEREQVRKIDKLTRDIYEIKSCLLRICERIDALEKK